MARTGRAQSTIGAYHIIMRCDGELILQEREAVRRLLYIYLAQSDIYTLALCPHGIHAVIRTRENISELVKPFMTSCARYINKRRGMSGRVFRDRFLSRALESREEIAESVVYIDSVYTPENIAKDVFFDEIMSREEYESRISGRLERVAFDDYAAMTDGDVFSLMCRLCGEDYTSAAELTIPQRRRLVKGASQHRWVSVRRMCDAVGLRSAADMMRGEVEAMAQQSHARVMLPITETDEVSAKTAAPAKKPKTAKSEEKPKSAVQTENTAPVGGEVRDVKKNINVWLL